MDASCLAYSLTDQEARDFDEQGYLILRGILNAQQVDDLLDVVDRVHAEEQVTQGIGPDDRAMITDFIGRDDKFMQLLDWPTTFPKVWGILGWNIQLYHSHLIVTPPMPADQKISHKGWHWHQDSGRLNQEMESDPRPRISLKVAYFLTDTRPVGSGNFYVVPGSHLWNRIEMPADGSNPAGATPVQCGPGDVAIFDRRIWHTASPNHAEYARKVLFYGYSYRWIRPRDNMTVEHYLDRSTPIQRQLLGASATGGLGYSSPRDEDVPLKSWLEEHAGKPVVA